MALVHIDALHKHFGSNHVLKGIDLDVEEGQVIALIAVRARARCFAPSTAWKASTTVASRSMENASTPAKPICAPCARKSVWCSSNSISFRT